MKHKVALIVAASLTAFLLVFGGAIAGRLTQAKAISSAPAPTADEIQSLYAQREAQYQARLDEANQALNDAYAQLDAVKSANVSASVVDPSQGTANSTVNLSPQDAMLIAFLANPQSRIVRMPDLVNFQGTVAYEVTLDQGVVYIDANDGTVLYNGAAQTTSVQSPTFGGEHEEQEGNDRD